MIHLLFDISCLGENYLISKPTGIHIATYNILKFFYINKNLKLSLYSEPEYYWAILNLHNNNCLPNNSEFIIRNDILSLSRNIFALTSKIQQYKNSIKITFIRKSISLINKIGKNNKSNKFFFQ